MLLLPVKVYKEDLPQLKQQSKEKNHAVPFLKREKAPEDSLKLQFIHGWVTCHHPYQLVILLSAALFRPALPSTLRLLVLNILTMTPRPVFSVFCVHLSVRV